MVSISVDASDGLEMLDELDSRMNEAVPNVAEKLSKEGAQRLQRMLYQKGHIVTGRGANSIDNIRISDSVSAVVGATYLRALDQGTSQGPPPWKNNKSLQLAALSYGMTPYQLSKAIGNNGGTRPHPFIRAALDPIIRSAKKKGQVEIDKAIRRSKS